MKRILPLLLLLLVTACGAAVGIKPHVAVGAGTLVDRMTFVTGTAGTATAPAGNYFTMCSAAGTATNATVTVTPCGPDIATCSAAAAIAIPSGTTWTMGPPALRGAPDEWGDGTSVVFANTVSYFCSLWRYN